MGIVAIICFMFSMGVIFIYLEGFIIFGGRGGRGGGGALVCVFDVEDVEYVSAVVEILFWLFWVVYSFYWWLQGFVVVFWFIFDLSLIYFYW